MDLKINKKKCIDCGQERLTVDESGRCILCRGNYIGPGTEVKEIRTKAGSGTEIKSKSSDYKKENSWMGK